MPDTYSRICPGCTSTFESPVKSGNGRLRRFCSDVCRWRVGQRERRERGQCQCCGSVSRPGKNTCQPCMKRQTARQRVITRKLRVRILDEYGGTCACCGESRREFLAIDHIFGGGQRDRRGARLYQRLRRQGFPKDRYRLLCHNCNQARGIYGYCPHEIEKSSAIRLLMEIIHKIPTRDSAGTALARP